MKLSKIVVELAVMCDKKDENWGSATLELAVKDHDEVDQDLLCIVLVVLEIIVMTCSTGYWRAKLHLLTKIPLQQQIGVWI